jgi:RHH-type proline utilization regulon transcriptional repressor/proline dehydrogenase/delta 1-pyrroline-5-carboxylate dehydrogenase
MTGDIHQFPWSFRHARPHAAAAAPAAPSKSRALALAPDIDRLPFPYRPEAEVVAAQRWPALHGSAGLGGGRPAWPHRGCMAVRDNPPPFWAMESLLKEYPISSAEGLALMRLAEALLRVPDAETAIALTADQLGRADFDGAADSSAMATSPSAMARLSSAAIALSKKFLPPSAGPGQTTEPPGLMARLGAKTVVAATLRAVQLLGRQFVLGQTIDEGMAEADAARRKQPNLSYSYDMLGEGARTDADALQYLASYQNAIKKIAGKVQPTLGTERNDGISIKLSALHPRYEVAQHARVMRELVPRVWGLCELAAQANISLTIDAEEVDRLELSLDVFEALAAQVALHFPQWSGFGLAMQSYQTRALALIEHVIALARRYRLRFMCRLVKGAYWDAEIKRAQELGLPHYPVFTHKHHTDVSYLACARALLAAPDAIYPQFATHNAGTIAAILQMAARPAGVDASGGNGGVGGRAFGAGQGGAREAGGGHGAERAASHPGFDPDSTSFQGASPRFELQRLHGMSEGTYREVLKNPLVALPGLRAGGCAPRPARLPRAPAAGERRQFVLRAPAGRCVGRAGRAAGVAPAPHAEPVVAAAAGPLRPGPQEQRRAGSRGGGHACAAAAGAGHGSGACRGRV